MRARALLSFVLVSAFAAVSACVEDATFSVEAFGAQLNGDNEVPAVTTGAVGAASFRMQGGVISYDVTLSNAPGIQASHIHLGSQGVNGGVLVTLGGPLTGTVNGTAYTGIITDARLVAPLTVDSLAALFRAQRAYVNVHSTSNPDGLIRGQVRPQ
jgi:hypothetical protein